MQGPKKPVHSDVFHGIDEELALKAIVKTKGGCGLSSLDADNWRRSLTSHYFGFLPVDLRKSFANFVKGIYIKNIYISDAGIDNSLKTFTASRLKPLDKNPRLCPIGVGEVLC